MISGCALGVGDTPCPARLQLEAEIERLRAHGASVVKEYGKAQEEIERLTAELDKATRLVGQSIQWQHDAEIKLLNLRAEKAELLAALKEVDALEPPWTGRVRNLVRAIIAKVEGK